MLFLLISCCFKQFFHNSGKSWECKIPIGAPVTVANVAIEILPVVRDKAVNDFSN